MLKSEARIALALSGGGYRATLFHTGALWRLNELGYLPKLSTVTSVSGGSIASAFLAMNWPKLNFDALGRAANYAAVIAYPLLDFTDRWIDVPVMVANLLSTLLGIAPGTLAWRYRSALFGRLKLKELPPPGPGTPRFVFYAASLQTGSRVEISQDQLKDYQIGYIEQPDIQLATAVAASSSYPPVLSPTVIRTNPAAWRRYPEDSDGSKLYATRAYRKYLSLVDGGVFDNLGVDGLWQDHSIILASDAGSPAMPVPRPGLGWGPQSMRAMGMMYQQVQALEWRLLQHERDGAAPAEASRQAAYWSVASEIREYSAAKDAIVSDKDETASLGDVPTQLRPFPDEQRGQLVNWGYALCDVALRSSIEPHLPPLTQNDWPIPKYAL